MPLISVTLAEGLRTPEQKHALLTAITGAVESSIEVPRSTIRVWINEVKPSEFMAGGELLSERHASALNAAVERL
jgi:4-oxalocrotonate tautomerase family enzyme